MVKNSENFPHSENEIVGIKCINATREFGLLDETFYYEAMFDSE